MLSHARKRPSASGAQKQHLVGQRSSQVAPAWRSSARDHRRRSDTYQPYNHTASHYDRSEAGPSEPTTADGGKRKLVPEGGSKILVSNLPEDVSETDLYDLFKSMVGPVKTLFIIYNATGHHRGCAVVHFYHVEHASKARNLYHGKVIDGRNILRVQLITDPPSYTPLLSRIRDSNGAPAPAASEPASAAPAAARPRPKAPSLLERLPPSARPKQQQQLAAQPHAGVQGKRKKGPKRLQKKTLEELDAEMDEWRAAAEP
ncbi:RNA-binding domain-containing protein [Auricularia subglabra TFB-10046 SS5]|nr:RNA-binding domain-containing protein [Auricularia subglabra TFB-10046 SS5]